MVKIALALHANKEDAYEVAKNMGLTGEALRMASFLGYEEIITYEVDPETGIGTIFAINNRELKAAS